MSISKKFGVRQRTRSLYTKSVWRLEAAIKLHYKDYHWTNWYALFSYFKGSSYHSLVETAIRSFFGIDCLHLCFDSLKTCIFWNCGCFIHFLHLVTLCLCLWKTCFIGKRKRKRKRIWKKPTRFLKSIICIEWFDIIMCIY